MYTKILVPLDGSATAEAVLPYAEAFAAGFKTSVELLSVLDARWRPICRPIKFRS